MGRNALFGLGAGGTEGVERVYEILKAEIETTMRLLAVEKVEDLGPQHVSFFTLPFCILASFFY
jgi:L-lactate dehydrogenase (cytochrome)